MISISTFLFLAQQATQNGTQGGQGNMLTGLLPFVFMFVIAYFLLIRPQQKRQKEHQTLLSSLKTGDEIVTTGGIHGLISNVKDKTVIVKIADNVKVELERSAVASVTRASEKPEKTEKTEEPKSAS
jgi:preprotein translocase subunit YajC